VERPDRSNTFFRASPEEVLRNAIPSDVRATFPEEEVEREGELEVAYKDGKKNRIFHLALTCFLIGFCRRLLLTLCVVSLVPPLSVIMVYLIVTGRVNAARHLIYFILALVDRVAPHRWRKK
jgi:hypothetical protein